jgi:lipoate-protein ligase A
VIDAGKLVGSAQARRGGAVLQHGSVLLAIQRADWQGLFGTAGLEVALAELLPSGAPDESAVREALRRGLADGLGATFVSGAMSATECSIAKRLRAER